MPRPESVAKAGFYPTPVNVVEGIAGILHLYNGLGMRREDEEYRLIDPCCGTGEALDTLARLLQNPVKPPVVTYGIELNAERAAEASRTLNEVMNADLFNCSVGNDCFSLLWLNPPYDFEGDDSHSAKRTELSFLQRSTAYLRRRGGVLVYIVPRKRVDAQMTKYLATHYENFTCMNFPPERADEFGQFVVIAEKKRAALQDARMERVIANQAANPPDWMGQDYSYTLPATPRREVHFTNWYYDPETVANEARQSGLWDDPALERAIWPQESPQAKPLMPLRQGHIAMLTAAGFLDNLELTAPDGKRVLVKGKTYKEFRITENTDEKTVRQERMRTTIMTLDLDTGEFEEIRA